MIRLAVPADAEALAAIHRQAFPDDPWSAASILASLDGGGVWVEDAPLGFALFRAVADEAELLTLAVRPDRRRRGIGAALLAWTCRAAHARGARVLHLEVGADNPAALALYGRCGFAEVGRRPGYYRRGDLGRDGHRVDAILLSRHMGG